jgi:hypothetical protein
MTDSIASTQAMGVCVRSILGIAADVEAAETAIKQAIITAANAGDTARVTDIVTRWMTMPAVEVLGAGDCGQHITTESGHGT